VTLVLFLFFLPLLPVEILFCLHQNLNYTGGFSNGDSITQVISEGDKLIEAANCIPLRVEITGNETVGRTLSVTEVTTLSRLSVTGNETVTGTLSVSEATTLSSLSVIGNETVGRTLSVTDATTLSSLYVIGNETARRTLSVMEATTLNGNVGTGGASGPDNLLVTGSERVTGNLHVGGDFIVDGSFNYNEVIQNITAVNNEVVISTQLDILNEGTGPALKLTQTGAGDDQDVAVFNAGDEGNTLKIDSSGNSIF
jgi:hypothetical protein